MQTSVTKKSNGCVTRRILLDLLIILLLVAPLMYIEYCIGVVRRGFFCSDSTIQYPYIQDTLTPRVMVLFVLVPAITVLLLGECTRNRKMAQQGPNRQISGHKVTKWRTNAFEQFAYFCFGLLLVVNVTELMKYTIGRLRPHFIAVCQPVLPDGSPCCNWFNQKGYVDNCKCQKDIFPVNVRKQSHLSFPSLHTSLSFYVCFYISLYLEERMHKHRSSMPKIFIQFCFFLMACCIGIDRFVDNLSHWTDILAGSLIGILGAVIATSFMRKFVKTSNTENAQREMVRCPQDTAVTAVMPPANEKIVATAPPYIMYPVYGGTNENVSNY